MKSILITGATGYTGSFLANRLADDGWDVHVLQRASNLQSPNKLSAKIQIHRISTDRHSIAAVFTKHTFSLVYHLAAYSQYHCPPDEISKMVESNILFGTYLLEAMIQNGCKHLVNTGSYWQHFESEKKEPICFYAATKQAFSDIVDYYAFAKGLTAVSLHLYDTYGPHDPRPKVFSLIENHARERTPLPMSAGDQLLSMIHIEDVVDAFVLAGERLAQTSAPGHEIFYVHGEMHSLRHIVESYVRSQNLDLSIQWGQLPYRDTQIMKPYLGPRLPGWQPKISLSSGLESLRREPS